MGPFFARGAGWRRDESQLPIRLVALTSQVQKPPWPCGGKSQLSRRFGGYWRCSIGLVAPGFRTATARRSLHENLRRATTSERSLIGKTITI
jgi:hypothetical protein